MKSDTVIWIDYIEILCLYSVENIVFVSFNFRGGECWLLINFIVLFIINLFVVYSFLFLLSNVSTVRKGIEMYLSLKYLHLL